jgi:hypothetical protein
MTFAEAAAFALTSGSHRGPIGIIAVREEGLLYLDWRARQPFTPLDEVEALETYLSNETIRAELERLQTERG